MCGCNFRFKDQGPRGSWRLKAELCWASDNLKIIDDCDEQQVIDHSSDCTT